MSARSAQAHRLAAALTEHCGVPVRMAYVSERDFLTRQDRDFWKMSWTDGPSVTTMRAEIARRAARYPALDVAGLGFSRSSTELTKAAALLVWLPTHPEELSALGDIDTTFVADLAFGDTDYPEQLPDSLQRRARALIALDRQWLSLTVVRQLGQHCARGWEHAEQWLDTLLAVQDGRAGDNVIDLRQARTRRSDQR